MTARSWGKIRRQRASRKWETVIIDKLFAVHNNQTECTLLRMDHEKYRNERTRLKAIMENRECIEI